MIVDFTQEEVDLIVSLWRYMDYLGYSTTDEELALVNSIFAKLGGE